MKNGWRLLLCLIAVCALIGAGAARAGYVGPGAVQGATTVAEILKAPKDDTPATLRGHIVKKVGGEKYIFQDKTGSIRVEIDDDILPAQHFSDKSTVEIHGEVEKDFLQSPEIDVDLVRVLED